MPKGPKKWEVISKDLFGPDDGGPNRSLWWWLLIAPGKTVLGLEYMFPERLGEVFGSRRGVGAALLFRSGIALWCTLLFSCLCSFSLLL